MSTAPLGSGNTVLDQAKAGVSSLNMPLNAALYDFHSRPLFSDIRFIKPVDIVSPPGETGRLFVVEHSGKIQVIPNLSKPRKAEFLDLTDQVYHFREAGLNGMAFHPKFKENGYFFVYYNYLNSKNNNKYNRLSRFKTDPLDPNRALKESETPLFTQLDEHSDHNGGDLLFGPDGYLYLSLGDEGGGYDQYHNAQRIDKDFFAGIIRIDVDELEQNLEPNPHPAIDGAYKIPADNPFLGLNKFFGKQLDPTQIRTELFATGLRNAWRMCMDSVTGKFYITDTGDHTREEINMVKPGANFGYPMYEGSVEGPRYNRIHERIRDDLVFPIAEYGKELGLDIAGLHVFRGDTIPELKGKLIFSDFHGGNLGSLDLDENGESDGKIEWILNQPYISSFGTHPVTGDLLMADYGYHQILVLQSGPDPALQEVPEKLSETGIFSDVAALRPSPGITPYDVNVTFWSDHAIKRRWFGLPKEQTTFKFEETGRWRFTPGTTLVKHFDMLMDRNDPNSKKRLETRVITMIPGDWMYGVTYRWNEEQTEAFLVRPEGEDAVLNIISQDGEPITQKWRFPGVRECYACHNFNSTRALGFKTSQLNRNISYNGIQTVNQLQAWEDAGLFEDDIPPTGSLRVLANADDVNFRVEYRVRSYLDANCAQCHHPTGISSLRWDARAEVSLDSTGIVNKQPYNKYGSLANYFIRPNDPTHSVILERISKLSIGRMPPVGSTALDERAKQLLTTWIEHGLDNFKSFSDWQIYNFGSAGVSEANSSADPDLDGRPNYVEYLLGSSPLSANKQFDITVSFTEAGHTKITFPYIENRRFQALYSSDWMDEGSWQYLDEPENSFQIPATNSLHSIEDRSPDSSKRFNKIIIKDSD